MIKRIAFSTASLVLTAGMLVATSGTAQAVTSANTCKERGYTTILATKAIKSSTKTYAHAYMTYNKNKGQEYCIVMRNRTGASARLTVRTLKNDGVTVDEYRVRISAGASGSVSFNRESSARQQAFIENSAIIGWTSFYY